MATPKGGKEGCGLHRTCRLALSNEFDTLVVGIATLAFDWVVGHQLHKYETLVQLSCDIYRCTLPSLCPALGNKKSRKQRS